MNKKVFALLFVFGFCRFTYADTFISGYQAESATWTKNNSPYILNNVSFDIDTNLTIEAGTTVLFQSNEDLNVFGSLNVTGTQDEPVIFSLLDGATDDAKVNLFYAVDIHISHANFKGVGIDSFSSIATLDNVSITNFSDGVRLFQSSDVDISDFDISSKNYAVASFEDSNLNLTNGKAKSEGVLWPAMTIGIYAGNANIEGVKVNSDFGTPIVSFAQNLFISNTNLSGGLQNGIELYSGNNFISSTTVRNFNEAGIVMYGATSILIDNSDISNNTKGIAFYIGEHTQEVSLRLNEINDNGEGLAVYGSSSNPEHVPDIRYNWWGDASGPLIDKLNSNGKGDVINLFDASIVFKPWLTKPDGAIEPCCSSVAFLPGIQASRLYKKGLLEDQLWEPNPSLTSDVAYLYLNQDGTSKNSGIYTKDVIDRTNSGGNIFDFDVYKDFILFMNKLVSDQKIKEWKAFPYDWRFDYEAILNNGIKYETYTQNLVEEIIKMASSSKTGKISLVTHSNGGLLAKVLVNKLKSQGKESLIDKMVLVAPPQLGTPKAIGGLVHGEEQTIKIIAGKSTVRQLGENMKSAYNLVPSEMYFDIVQDPVIKISSTTSSISNLYQSYGPEVDSYNELISFLTASRDRRTDPKAGEVEKPNVLSSTLLSSAKQVHSQIDNWIPPENIDFIQVVGWGVFTTSGLEYFKNDKDKLDYKTIKTIDGDETVVTPSVTSNMGRTYYFDMLSYGSNQTAVKHVDIMEAGDIQKLVRGLVTDSLVKLPEYITLEKPEYQGYQNMRIGLHSPVSLGVYDSFGNYTGLKLDEESGEYYVEEGIPNSLYEEIGDGKYVYLFEPGNTRIELQGLGTGTFTLEVEKREGEEVIDQHVFSDIPTTANTEGEVFISNEEAPTLQVDIEGDGVIDAEVQGNEELSIEQYIALIKKTVLNLDISKNLKEKLMKRIEKIEKLLSKSKDKKVIKKIKDFNHKLKHLAKQKYNKHGHKKMTKADAEALMVMINELLDLLEQK